MAHGAGGKATQTLIEGLFVPAFGSPALAALADAGTLSIGGVDVALTTDSFVVKPIRFPGGSIGELAVNGTVNDLAVAGRQAAGAQPVDGARGGPAGRRAARRGRRDRRGPPSRPACRSSPATRRSSSAATPTRCTSARPGVGAVDARASLSPASLRPGDRIIVSGTIGDHGTAIMLARGEFELDARRGVRHLLAVAGGRRAARRGGPAAALHARRDARRGRLGAQRAGARLRRGDDRARGRRAGAAGGGRRRGDPRHRPDVRGQRGQARGLRGARGGGRGAGGAARGARAASARWRSAR